MSVSERWEAAIGVDCPDCGAGPGQRCKRSELGLMGHCVGRYQALDAAVTVPCDAEEPCDAGELTLP